MSPEEIKEVENKEFDCYQPRRVILTRDIKNETAEFIHQSVKLKDEVWIQFNKTLNPRRVLNAQGSFDYKNDEEKAIRETYRKLVKEIPQGYQKYFKTQLTEENFYDLIPLEDQTKVLEEIFAFDISETETDEFFFDEVSENIFDIDIKINGQVESVVASLTAKSKKDEEIYNEAIKQKHPPLKKFRHTEISTLVNFDKLKELFDKLSGKQQIPIWLKIGLIRYYFDDFGQSEVKK